MPFGCDRREFGWGDNDGEDHHNASREWPAALGKPFAWHNRRRCAKPRRLRQPSCPVRDGKLLPPDDFHARAAIVAGNRATAPVAAGAKMSDISDCNYVG